MQKTFNKWKQKQRWGKQIGKKSFFFQTAIKKNFVFEMEYFHPTLVQDLVKCEHPILAKAYEACKDKRMGFKRCHNAIVGLLLPPMEDTTLNRPLRSEDRRRAKFRAKYILNVEFIYFPLAKQLIPYKKHSWNTTEIVYVQGQKVYPDSYDPDPLTICSHGIHFYLTLEAALGHDSGWEWRFELEAIAIRNFLNYVLN